MKSNPILYIDPQVAHIVLMAALAAFAFSDSDLWQEEFLAANLAALMLLSVFNAVFQGSVTASLGPFPEKYMGGFMSGQGVGGIVPSVLNVVIIASDADPQSTGFYSFVFVTAAEVGCLVLLYFMQRNEFYRHHSDKGQNQQGRYSRDLKVRLVFQFVNCNQFIFLPLTYFCKLHVGVGRAQMHRPSAAPPFLLFSHVWGTTT